jgi:uncharacterized membrane protein
MRFLGHPVHPMLVHFPVAFWTLGTFCDGLTLAGVHGAWPEAALFLIIGLASAVPAAVAGLIDFAALPEKSARTGSIHMLLMGTAWCLYLVAMLLRSSGLALADKPEWAAVILSFMGFLVLVAGGYYGGRLVYQFGAGVNEMRPDGS